MVENWNDLVNMLPSFGVRLAIAFACGLLLGMERERKDKPAGLRTIVLITVGSALYMIVSSLIPFVMQWPADVTRADPGRIAAQVVSGIGFLGAGTIIQARGAVQGLTTAAVIWVSAGIGMCAGLGFPILAFVFTSIVLAALLTMDPLRTWLSHRGHEHEVCVIIPDDALVLQRVHFTVAGHDVPTSRLEVEREDEDHLRVRFVHRAFEPAAARLLEALARIEGVRGPRAEASSAGDALTPETPRGT